MPEKKPFIFPKKPRGCCFGGGGGSTVAGIGVGVRGDARAMASLFRRGVGGGCRSLARKTSGASTCTRISPALELGNGTPCVEVIAKATCDDGCALDTGKVPELGGGTGLSSAPGWAT